MEISILSGVTSSRPESLSSSSLEYSVYSNRELKLSNKSICIIIIKIKEEA